MDNISSLFHTSLDRIKASGQNQYTAICPFHNDHKRSFSFNDYSGLSYCFTCGWKGNAYQYAKEREFDNPKQYIIDDRYTSSNTLIDKNVQNVQYIPKKENQEMAQNAQKTDKKETNYIELANIMEQYKQNLKDQWDMLEYKNVWDKSIIDNLDIGIDNNGLLQFAHHDIDGKIICIKAHNTKQMGDGRSKWFLRHKIAEFSKEKEIYICEGEKDSSMLYSMGLQTTSSTTGCTSIPKNDDGENDLEWLKDWKEGIFICYDNDDGGRMGGEKMAKAIAKEYPHLNVYITKWNDSLDEKYDVYDAFNDEGSIDGRIFWSSVANAKRYEIPSSFDWISGYEANTIILPKTEEIIDKLMPKGRTIILGGTTGSNKSYMAMQWGMSLVSNADEFLGYNINAKDLRVLYVDTEVGKALLVERYQEIQQYMNWNNEIADKWLMISAKDNMDNVWEEIERAIIRHRADAVFIDCLYNISDGKDISKNHYMSEITKKVTYLQRKYEPLTPIVIAHTNKGGHEEGLHIDRLTGGSALQNWVEHCIMVTKTNEEHKRIMRFAKSRVLPHPTCYFELNWDGQKKKITNVGIIDNPKSLLITEESKKKWAYALENISEEFTWTDWLNEVVVKQGKSETTAKNWKNELLGMDAIEQNGFGKYKKKRKLIKDEE